MLLLSKIKRAKMKASIYQMEMMGDWNSWSIFHF